MALNQILYDEQIALMAHSAATEPSEIRKHSREIGRLAGKLSLFTYPHRPYPAPDPAGTMKAARGVSHDRDAVGICARAA